MPESAANDPVRKAIGYFLEQAYGATELDKEGDFVVHRHGGITWIRVLPIDDEHTAVIPFSPVVIGMRVDGELTRFLATEGLELDLAHFELHERAKPMVVVSHTLLGEYLSREELTTAIDEVSAAARRYGPELAQRFGGFAPGTLLHVQSVRTPDPGGGKTAPASPTVPVPDPAQLGSAPRSASRLRGALRAVGLLGGLAAAAVVYAQASSWWLAGFVFVMVSSVVGVAIAEVLTEGHKVRRAAFFAVIPAVSTAIVALTYWLWGRWWLAVVLGVVLGLVGGAILRTALLTDIALEEMAQAKERQRRGYLARGMS